MIQIAPVNAAGVHHEILVSYNRRVKIIIRTLLYFSLLIPAQSLAAIDFEDAATPELAVSGRALAMGNAFVAKVDDPSAVFYNPAGLGTIRKTTFHLSNFHFETNKGWMQATTGGKAGEVPSTFPKGFSLDGTRQVLLANRKRLAHSRFHLMPNLTTRYFSLGYLYAKQTRAYMAEGDNALFEYATRKDQGPYWALNLSIFGGIVKFGITGLWLTRKEKLDDADKDTAIALVKEDYKIGKSWQFVSGFKFTMPIAWLPTIAIKMNNSFGNHFSTVKGSNGPPEDIKQSVDVGFSLAPQIGRVMRVHFEINYKDATDEFTEVSTGRKITAGMEIDIKRTVFFRFGYGDGFGSAGLGVATKKLQFDLSTYSVDTTTSAFRGEEDRRFSLTVSSGIL